MKKQISVFFLVGLLFLGACAPKVSTNLTKHYPSLDFKEVVYVIDVNDPYPANCISLGTVKIGDTGFSTNCGMDAVINCAKLEARKAGGNALKIVEHISPDFLSSCHRITAQILKVENVTNYLAQVNKEEIDSTASSATLYVYRPASAGMLVSYNLYFGDSIVCRIANRFKQEIKLDKKGMNEIWAKTEAKTSVPIDVKFGHKYYLRCGISMGIVVGRPSFEFVDARIGKMEYESLKAKN
jgi:Tfp pilus tip-associated adhesin PilY1